MAKIKKLKKSFSSAFKGLYIAFKEEQTFQIEVVIGLIVVFLMFLLPLKDIEKIVLTLMIILVLGLELINSQIERILDFSHLGFHPKIKRIKDLSAAAVLIFSLGALFIGALILFPALLKVFNF